MESATPVRATTVEELLAQSRSVVVDEHGVERSCAEILQAGRQLASRLARSGLQRGDRIAVQMANTALYLDLLAAAAVGGYVVAAVNQRFAPALAESIIERAGARLVVRSASDLPDDDSDAVQSEVGRPTPNDRFAIFTTSGTTSAPKLVVHQQRSVAVHAGDVAVAFEYDAESVVMIPLPLCGVFGFTVLWAAFAAHATVILPTAFDANVAAALIEQHQVSSLHGSDDMFHRLLATPRDLSSISCSGYGRFNSALDGIVQRADHRGIPLAGLYGMSEVQALYAWRGRPGLGLEERWRAGGPLVSPQAECRVVDGELQLQGPSLFEGYLADGGAEVDRDLTAAAFDGPWFKTGDLGAIDGDRSFEYIARMGDAMRLGGFLVAPAEIEGVLIEWPAIEQAQVVAVATERGTRPVAFVILHDNATLDERGVIDHCAQTLARFKCPIRVLTVHEFPVTDGPNGVKIQRSKLRAMAEVEIGTP